MNDDEFALNLSCFLDPLVLVQSVQRYDEERGRAVAPAELILTSGYLKNGVEGNFSELVKQFLRGFKTGNALVSFLKEWNGTLGFSKSSWRWLENLSLAEDLTVYGHGEAPGRFPLNTILVVRERDAVIDLIRDPLLALLDIAGRSAVHWRPWAQLDARTYFSSNSPNLFYAYTEYRVASYFLDFVSPSDLNAASNLIRRYRAVTVTGSTGQVDRFWEVAREAARVAAASTFEPMRESLK